MNGRKSVLLSLVAMAAVAAPLGAQEDSTPKREPVTQQVKHPTKHRSMYPKLIQERPGLLEQTAVTPDSAALIALRGVEDGKVVARRLVKRGENLVYVISVRPKGAKVSKSIHVDAKTGEVLEEPASDPQAPAPRG